MIHLLLGVLALAALVGAGYAFVTADGARRPLPLTLAFSHLAGSAGLAFGVTLGLVLTNRVSVWAGAAGLVALAAAGVIRRRFDWAPAGDAWEPRTEVSSPRWVSLIFAALILLGLAAAVLRLALLPVDWDGWAIWQLKARAMVHGDLQRVLTTSYYAYDHPDYPLLVPAHVWWLCAGSFQPKIGQGVDFLFALDLLLIFYYEAAARTSRTAALAGCAAILSWAPFLKHSASGFADVPMAAAALAFTGAFLRRDLWLAALFLTGALLTKNEGLFLLAAAVMLTALLPEYRRSGALLRDACLVMVVAALFSLAPWTVMKHRWELHADLLDPSQWPRDLMRQLPGRLATIAGRLVRQALSIGPRYPGWGFLWPLALAGLAVSIRCKKRATAGYWLTALMLFLGAMTAYVITPIDSGGHMDSSLDRLALHAAPITLLALLMAFFGPADASDSAPHSAAD